MYYMVIDFFLITNDFVIYVTKMSHKENWGRFNIYWVPGCVMINLNRIISLKHYKTKMQVLFLALFLNRKTENQRN